MRTHWILTLCSSWLMAFALGNGVLAQDKQELSSPKVPVEQLLNRDGTLDLKSGFRGSLDPAGWQMTTGPNGEPRFIPASTTQQTAGAAQLMAVPGDENWDDRFGTLGLNFYVFAIAVSGSEAYVGGFFTNAGGVPANYIAKWDGTNWSALGRGMNGGVNAIAVSGSAVYAAGQFTTAGGFPANRIAKWDGTDWSALGSGINANDYVFEIAVSGSVVYAAGQFTTAGGVAANNIAKWDGTSWSALGSGLNGPVTAITVSGNEVYAGGYFTTAGGYPANYIAKWEGTSWSALGSGMNGIVQKIAVSGSEVYAGGWFTTAGEGAANYIAKWNGTSWSALGSGMNNYVYAIAISGSEVYAAGYFTTAGEVPANHIAKWDGTSWSALGDGLNHYVWAIDANGTEVYAGGYFTTAGGKPSSYFGRYVSNAPPVANAGADQTVITATGSAQITLNGSGFNDPDIDPLSYTWEDDGNVIAGPSNSATSQVTLSVGSHTIELTVGDGKGATATDVVIITVKSAEDAIDDIIAMVNSLDLKNGGIRNAVLTKLSHAQTSLQNGDSQAAVGKLNAFINQVNAQRGKAITEADADALITQAQAIIAAINAASAPKIAFSAAEIGIVPNSYELEQNYPNPFNPSTTIQFSVLEAGVLQLSVYNMNGQEVRALVSGQMNAGRHTITWDGKDNAGQVMPSGIYLYKLRVNGFAQTRKMTIMK